MLTHNPPQNRLTAGIILVVLGLGLLAVNLLDSLPDSSGLFLLGSVFVIGYFVRHAYGLLVPGSILIGLGLGTVGESVIGLAGLGAVGLGLGFVMIYLIDVVYTGRTHFWPLIPGSILVLAGLSTGNAAMRHLLAVGWPLVLIVLGLLILAGAWGLTSRRTG